MQQGVHRARWTTGVVALVVLSLVCVGILVAGIVHRVSAAQDPPSRRDQLGEPLANDVPASLSVSRRTGVTAGDVVTVLVSRGGAVPLRTATLYDTGREVATLPVAEGRRGATFQWPALRPGVHLLSASTEGADGDQGHTQTVGVTVAASPAGDRAATTVPVGARETVAALRTRLGGGDAFVPDPRRARHAVVVRRVVAAPGTGAPTGQSISPVGPPVAAAPSPQAGSKGLIPIVDASPDWVQLSDLPPTAVLPQHSSAVVDLSALADQPPPGVPGSKPVGAPTSIPTVKPSAAPTTKGPGGGVATPTGKPTIGNNLPSAKPSTGSPKPAPVTGNGKGTFEGGLSYAVTVGEGKACSALLNFSGNDGKTVQLAYSSNSRPVPRVLADSKDSQGVVGRPIPAGTGLLYVRWKNHQSPPLPVSIPATCAGTWNGNLQIVDGILTMAQPGGDIYLYLTAKGYEKKGERAPKAAQSAISMPGTSVDITPYLPQLPQVKDYTVQVWRQPGAKGTATKIAQATLTLSKDYDNIEAMIGAPNALTLEVKTGEKTWGTSLLDDKQPRSLELRWTSADASITAVMWQVLRVPLTPANSDAQPLGLMASGADVGEGLQADGYHGSFTLPASALAPPPGETGWVQTPTGDPDPKAKDQTSTPLEQQSTDAAIGDLVQFTDAIAPGTHGRVFVRVIGLVGTPSGFGTSGIASNLVAYDPPQTGVADLPTFKLTSSSVVLPKRSDLSLVSCIRVTKLPYDASGKLVVPQPPGVSSFTIANMFAFYPKTGTYCPDQFGYDPCDIGCQFGQLLEIAAQAWDAIAAAYASLIDTVAGVIAVLNPVCLGAKAAGADSVVDTCEKITKFAATVAINVALTAVGLPPALPTSAQLAAAAQGSLEDLALSGLTALGVPCDSLTLGPAEAEAAQKAAAEAGVDLPKTGDGKPYGACEIIVHAVVEGLKENIKQSITAATFGNAGMPAYPTVVGFEAIPEPAGRQGPAVVQLSAEVVPGSVPQGFDLPGFDFSVSGETSSPWYPDTTVQMLTNAKGYSWVGIAVLPNLKPLDPIVYGAGAQFVLSSNDAAVSGLPVTVKDTFPF